MRTCVPLQKMHETFSIYFTCIDGDRAHAATDHQPYCAAHHLHNRMQLDKVAIMWIVVANLLAGGMMYQRLDKMGYLGPLRDAAAAVFEPVLAQLGLSHAASYSQCGLQNSTSFIITSSRVVHPDGVRPGAGECMHGTVHVLCTQGQSGAEGRKGGGRGGGAADKQCC